MTALGTVTALGMGAVLVLAGCRVVGGKEADPALVRALPVAAPAAPRPGATTAPAARGKGGWPRALPRFPGASGPVALVVPRAEVNAPVTPIESGVDGALEPPSLDQADLAGWDRLGPAPGEPGSAVVVGHLDTRTGPAVFAGLSRVRKGDAVVVTREDGTAAVFRVSAIERVRKSAFPVKKVYGSLPHPTIRLVTCGGAYDVERHSYDDNLIVYGDLAGWYRLSDFSRA
ncbi:class F sortase [Streptosporangium roseum]|uniref:class F sortase n=1 Tax=Streptosporangium roseum TaxID=2001 RepID=UPI00332EEF11